METLIPPSAGHENKSQDKDRDNARNTCQHQVGRRAWPRRQGTRPAPSATSWWRRPPVA